MLRKILNWLKSLFAVKHTTSNVTGGSSSDKNTLDKTNDTAQSENNFN